MNSSKLLIGTAAGTLVYFFLGWAVYGALLSGYFDAHTTSIAGFKKPETEMNMGLMVLSCASFALLLTYIFLRWAGIRTFMSGLTAGAIIAALFSISFNSGLASMSNYFTDNMAILVDALASALTGGIAGGAIGWALGYGEKY